MIALVDAFVSSGLFISMDLYHVHAFENAIIACVDDLVVVLSANAKCRVATVKKRRTVNKTKDGRFLFITAEAVVENMSEVERLLDPTT
mmetsp:Transcript_16934/g.25123  ORF Transcript_16934/g.25123 Transcript_16934/m.25123 type:complete len:89 (-) Transcript_16934:94-360(-)